MTKPTVGFIGLGIMGKPMALNLVTAGYPLVVHNRSQESVDVLVGAGAVRAGAPREVASGSDIIVTMLPDSPDVERVVSGEGGLFGGMRKEHLLVDMSTINPIVSRKIGKELAVRGASMLDAPVSGGEQGAIDGILSIMVGGTAQDFERARPLFDVMGKTITHIGDLGSGGFAKLANQIIVAINLTAIGEALVLGARSGVDPEKMIQALSGGMAASRCLEMKGPKILSGDFAPGFKVDLHAKDLRLVHEAADALGVPVPTTALVEQYFSALRARDRGGEDHSAVIRFFEDLAGIEVRAPDR
jgi:2-hydroxy-3-oxopropionate reductase